ncbi:hypothetical protein RN001_001927 [Aquatica leii]|uniref:Cytosol aminopeptidase domain-containing protein n=1 Tax=Aquatica leii TaxID=1421715 RepID=A0AAN7PLR0_9COLE|nr:hypothetical protein RN001_001927 [Aquatica leii]
MKQHKTKNRMIRLRSKFLSATDPLETPVIILGRLLKLKSVGFQYLRCKLDPRVSEEIYKTALGKLKVGETCSLYLNNAIIAAIPFKCSRHNTPSRCHAITRLITSCSPGVYDNRCIVIVCEYNDVFASACAVARAFRNYTKKTGPRSVIAFQVSVEFVVVPAEEVTIFHESMLQITKLSNDDLKWLENVCSGIRIAARITETPCNEMNVENFLEEIQAIGLLLNVKPVVIRGQKLQEKGFGGIYGVGKAALEEPALAILSYTPENAKHTIAWVGKGIVYDTGGLCLKAKTEMVRMKQDCGGAAAILGAFYAIVTSGFTENLHAIFCLAENSVGPLATRPDDIHTLYSGRTVEINNTDAEGRLVLADGVVYAKRNLNANVIIDMATLTGAQGIATGKYHAAFLTNNETWEKHCMEAGKISGDLTFPLPYTPELHMAEFESIYADMKNSSSSNAASCCGGLFIGAHLGFDFRGVWIHVDMASPVHCGEKATGYGVALLCVLFGHLSKQQILQNISPHIEINEIPRNSSKLPMPPRIRDVSTVLNNSGINIIPSSSPVSTSCPVFLKSTCASNSSRLSQSFSCTSTPSTSKTDKGDINGDAQFGFSTPTLTKSSSESKGFCDQVLDYLITIGTQNRQILKLLTTNTHNNSIKAFELSDDLELTLPVSNLTDLRRLEEYLSNNTNLSAVASYLSGLGG